MYDELPPQMELFDLNRPTEADLMDRVAQLQLEVDALTFVQSGPLRRFSLNRRHLHPPKCISSVG